MSEVGLTLPWAMLLRDNTDGIRRVWAPVAHYAISNDVSEREYHLEPRTGGSGQDLQDVRPARRGTSSTSDRPN